MIKEIEVGGVKHSITLSDDMIGSGLKRDEYGAIGVFLSHGLKLSTGLDRTIEVDVSSLCGSGLNIAEGKLGVDISKLAGAGLVASGGKLNIIGGGGSVDAGSLAGSGLRTVEGNKLALALSGSNLLNFASDGSLDINLLQVCGSGLKEEKGKLMPSLSGDAYLKFANDWTLTVNRSSLSSDLSGLGLRGKDERLNVKIAERTSGLRLILNDKGELDVTQ